jgi:hypothetical protein
MACNLYEIVPKFAKLGISMTEPVSSTNQTPLLIASLCGAQRTVRELQRAGVKLLPESQDIGFSQHDLFVEMLNREFPHQMTDAPCGSVRIEESSLLQPQSLLKVPNSSNL